MSTVLDVKDLKQHFKVNRKFTVKAVDGISFTIDEGEDRKSTRLNSSH